MNKTYKVLKKGVGGLIAGIVIAVIIFALTSPSFGFICVAVIVGGIVVSIVLRKEYTYSVTIDSESRSVTFITKSRTSTETDVCGFDEIYFTYRKRFDYYSVGFKNMGYSKEKRDILQIDCVRKALALLIPEQDGWTNTVIMDLAKTLTTLGVKQISDKYNDNEIAL
jgi:hypothetical protein